MTHDLLADDDQTLIDIIEEARVIAVIGASTNPSRPAHSVPAYLARHGHRIHAVNPTIEEAFGRPAVSEAAAVPEPVDLVLVFRRPELIPEHLDDILTAAPKVVWFQLGIRNDEVAAKLVEAGIHVIQNRCMLVEHRRLLG